MGKLMRYLNSLYVMAKAFGFKVMIQCSVRRMISFKLYEAYVYRYLTDYFKPVISMFKNEVSKTKDSDDQIIHIWSLWWQGEENAPEIVKVCIASQRAMLCGADVKYHILTKDNWQDYIDLPQYMLDKVEKGNITLTHFSDIIRAELIRKWGGIWIDATVYCAKKVNMDDRDNCFFTIKAHRGSDYYTLRRWTGFFIGDEKGSLLFDFMAEAFRYYWKKENDLIAYLLIDYLIAIAYEQFPQVKSKIDSLQTSDEELWSMLRSLNDPFDNVEWNRKIEHTRFFKLSYKDEFNGGSLRKKTADGNDTYWGYLSK